MTTAMTMTAAATEEALMPLTLMTTTQVVVVVGVGVWVVWVRRDDLLVTVVM